jgi:hypothetical protein
MNLFKTMTEADGWFHGVIALASAVEVLFIAACIAFLWRNKILFL